MSTATCERCGTPMPADPLRLEAAELGIDLGPLFCEPCFDIEQAEYFADASASSGQR